MTLRSIFLLSASLAITAGAASACGDGSKPKIRSFTATPATVPSLGGDTVLVWDVDGEDELVLEPDFGVVTGSAATVHVTETTTFTLIAKKDGRSDKASTTVTVAGASAVTGTVRNVLDHRPMPNALVWIKGHTATFTDANGNFTIENVETPYDIAVVDFEFVYNVVIMYLGVTRLDPVLEVQQINFPTVFNAQVSGTISPASPASTQTWYLLDTNNGLPIPAPSGGLDSYGPFPAMWLPEDVDVPTYDVTVHGLRWTVDTAGNPSGYTGYGRTVVTATNAVATVANVTLGAVGTDTTTGTIEVPATTTVAGLQGFVIFGVPTGSFEDEGFILPTDTSAVAADDTWELLSPQISGTIVGARVVLQDASSPANMARAYLPVIPGSSGNKIELPAPPRLLLPVNEGTISRDQVFSARTREDSVKVFRFTTGGLEGAVITDKSSFTFPDLREIGLDPFGGPISWSLNAEIAPMDGVDAAVSGGGLTGTSPAWYGSTESFVAFPENVVIP